MFLVSNVEPEREDRDKQRMPGKVRGMNLVETLKLLFFHKDGIPSGAEIGICIQVGGRQVPLKSVTSKEVYKDGEASFSIILHPEMEKQ